MTPDLYWIVVIALIPVSQRVPISLAENGVFIYAVGLTSVIVMAAICQALFLFKGELKAREGRRLY